MSDQGPDWIWDDMGGYQGKVLDHRRFENYVADTDLWKQDKCNLCENPVVYRLKFSDDSYFTGSQGPWNYLCEKCWENNIDPKILKAYEKIKQPEPTEMELEIAKWNKYFG